MHVVALRKQLTELNLPQLQHFEILNFCTWVTAKFGCGFAVNLIEIENYYGNEQWTISAIVVIIPLGSYQLITCLLGGVFFFLLTLVLSEVCFIGNQHGYLLCVIILVQWYSLTSSRSSWTGFELSSWEFLIILETSVPFFLHYYFRAVVCMMSTLWFFSSQVKIVPLSTQNFRKQWGLDLKLAVCRYITGITEHICTLCTLVYISFS